MYTRYTLNTMYINLCVTMPHTLAYTNTHSVIQPLAQMKIILPYNTLLFVDGVTVVVNFNIL